MALVDTHTHLQHPEFDGDRSAVLERALSVLDWLVVVGDDVATSRQGVALAGERVYATVGIHPHNADKASGESLEAIRELALLPGVVAIGEIGLDYHYSFSTRDRQREIFRRQLDMALECRMPVVIHCREAESDLAEIVKPLHRELTGAVAHCFGGDAGFAEQCLAWGFHISFAGNVTFPKSVALREAARVVPLGRLLIETDSPYLAPQPVRGRRCEPAFILHTASFLANWRDVAIEELTQRTTENAGRIFRLEKREVNRAHDASARHNDTEQVAR
jgi:TatD DNase family protein